ncbi:MAG: CinA family protein [Aquificae bacterium]|nr:CinA family protein [Aquificota bacterium]
MGFTVYFVRTFPTEGSLKKVFNLMADLGWEVDAVRFYFGRAADLLGLAEDAVIISADFEEVSLLFNEGKVNLYLPFSTARWEEVEELLKRRIGIFATYLRPSDEFDPPEGLKFVRNETGLYAVGSKPEGDFVWYTERGEPLEKVVGDLLREKGFTVATAESCTGGLLASTLVSVPGSSDYFKGSVVAYSNEVKEKVLGVSPETLKLHGAVSAQTAREMAEGVRRLLGTDFGLSTTGIAGPGGGTPQKPVGLTYMALSAPDDILVFREVFPYDRNQNRLSAVYYLLFELYKYLKGL